MLLNVNLFNQISFFLSGKREVESLELGSKLYGGATKIENTIYSNIEESNNITINEQNNKISLFIPSTLNADTNTDNTEYVTKYYKQIKRYFKNDNIIIHTTKGAWYSEDMQKTIIEDITIIEVVTKELKKHDINYMLNLGLDVKALMSQEAVSIAVNSSLCLV